jgi:hypothetical protein
MNDHGMPGPGGSLGECALCGGNFLAEVLLGKRVKSFTISQSAQTFHAHDKCIKALPPGQWDYTALPDGPLRKAFEKANAEQQP